MQKAQTSYFSLMSIMIKDCFSYFHTHSLEDIALNRAFLKDPMVAAYCDCSDNFTHEKLINYYEKLLKKKNVNLFKLSRVEFMIKENPRQFNPFIHTKNRVNLLT